MIFENREDAGRKLALKLKKYKDKGVVVLALPRGGLPIASEIASFLNTQLDLIVVRKIGAPNNPEFAVGAVASGGTWFLDKLIVQKLGITKDELDEISKKEVREMLRREEKYRDKRPDPVVEGKTVILADDGIATGATVIAAIRAVEKYSPKKIVLAVPVCSKSVFGELETLTDEFVCLEKPVDFTAVGAYYKNFDEVTDDDVKLFLEKRHSI